MVNIWVNQIAEACADLERQARIRQNEIDEVERVAAEIQGMSGMDQVTATLHSVKQRLESEQRALLDMVEGLIRIRQTYIWSENRVYDYGEGNTYRFRQPSIGIIKIPGFQGSRRA